MYHSVQKSIVVGGRILHYKFLIALEEHYSEWCEMRSAAVSALRRYRLRKFFFKGLYSVIRNSTASTFDVCRNSFALMARRPPM